MIHCKGLFRARPTREPISSSSQYEITDQAAIELTRAFYEALANGLPVDAALAEARKAVSLAVANSFEWGTPVLYMRSPDGVLFDLARPAPPVPAPVAAAVVAEAAVEPVSPMIQPAAPEPAPRAAPAGPAAEPAPVLPAPEPGRPSRRRLWLAIAGLAMALAILGIIVSRSGIIPGIQSLGLGALSGKVTLTEKGALVKEPVGMDLVRVPEGEFLMGSDPAKDPMAITDEDPQLSVTLAEYYIGLHEVTNAQYKAFVEATGHVAPEHWEAGRVPRGKEDHPAADVSWDDGDSPYGLADMSGNMLEWVADWYDGSYYDYSPLENPPGPESGDGRVFRGGSFWGHEADARCAWRGGEDPASHGGNFGFRVCVSPP